MEWNLNLLAKYKLKKHFRITIPIKECSSFIGPYRKAWKHESESVKKKYLDEDALFLISSRALLIAQVSAVNTDAE